MKRVAVAVLAAALPLGYIALAVYWMEAEKEVRILCGFITPGMTQARAVEALETGNLLRYAQAPGGGVGSAGAADPVSGIQVWSPWTLGTSRCSITVERSLEDGVEAVMVASTTYEAQFSLERVAADLATAGLAFLVVFQLLLAGGAPLGERAWGGRHRVLPRALRTASAVSALVLVAGVIVVRERVGAWEVFGSPGLVEVGSWLLVLLFVLSSLANALGASGKERRMGLPLAVGLAATCLLVALTP